MSFKSFLKQYRFEFILAAIVVGVSLLSFLMKDRVGLLGSREQFQDYVNASGIWGPLVIILTAFLEVIIAPIPGLIPPVVSGFLFGKLLGSVLVILGNVVGANFTFFIARKWGLRFFRLFIKETEIMRFEQMVHHRQNFLWAMYFIPLLPFDVLNIVLGMSKVSWRRFFVISTLGMSFSLLILTVFGSGLADIIFV